MEHMQHMGIEPAQGKVTSKNTHTHHPPEASSFRDLRVFR